MNLAALLLAPARESGDAPALRWRDETISFGDLAERVARLAGGLQDAGISPGDRVGVLCANNPFFVIAYLGALHAGAVAVPVNPMGAAEEVARELTGTGSRLAIVGPAGVPVVRSAQEQGGLGGVELVAAGANPEYDLEGATTWHALLTHDPIDATPREDVDVAVLVHTSGTSGTPKAAMLTHRNLAANIEQAQGHPTMRAEAGDMGLAVLPLFHVYGLNAVLGLSLANGSALVLAERFDPHDTLELVSGEAVTVLPGVPPMFQAWLSLPEIDPGAFESVRVAVSGASALSVEVQRQFADRFGVELHQGYGLTEASPIVTTTGAEGSPRPGSIGVPLPGVEVRLVDQGGDDALVGDPGEIWVRGENVFVGYWEEPEATARVLDAEGWLHTGDIAVADDEGYLHIVDRSKDLVIVSGFNVYPAEVEEVLVRHDGVAEAAVTGVPHPHTGESVKAYVVARSGVQLDADELVAFCGEYLARYKCPSTVKVVEALPKGLAGKVLRRELASTPLES